MRNKFQQRLKRLFDLRKRDTLEKNAIRIFIMFSRFKEEKKNGKFSFVLEIIYHDIFVMQNNLLFEIRYRVLFLMDFRVLILIPLLF